ncbi:dihydroxyacetone phosphate acyltransferase [Cydia pomonella]|uniref:dihydroxyacetone phosphate acyltransferase n=1 Tax=Cydia pomonella TaxID=82600 RepID=UPI002ADDC10C|nr:dihydroxyacetone phosphate acyltransferase [Cydia pomonella]
MSDNVSFKDILEPRRTESGIFRFMSRAWYPQRTLVMDKYLSPQDLKDIAASSIFLETVIEAESVKTGVPKDKLKEEVTQYLEEMGLEKKLHVIRWMGIVFLKIAFMMKIGIYVNEPSVLKLKEAMGSNPILFLPTHRSYADFCVMTYLCYHYDIDLPAVAAGMDFYSMAVVGRRMRETCAFYIRRTLAGAPLYAATLKQYVRTLVAKHCSPIEFFLEGTRSRSNKSLPPKYGMLSMSLVPWFAREVSDITIVPINISYDRLMEHGLFAYEHLGVPKPKESTGGLLKSLHRLNDHFGNIYINLGSPLSVREYLNAPTESAERLKPVDLQQLTPAQFQNVQDLANYVITLQQKNTVVTISNLLALVLMQSLMKSKVLSLPQVLIEVEWMVGVLRQLEASVFENDVKSSVERVLVVHRSMMRLDQHSRLRLVSSEIMEVSADVQKKMKGHIIKAETMVNAVPIIQLQLYVNPVLHYLVPPAVLCVIVARGPTTREQLVADYNRIRTMLRHEFFHLEKTEAATFSQALEYCLQNGVLATKDSLTFTPGSDEKLSYLLKWAIWPALSTLLICADVMTQQTSCTHREALKLVQAAAEARRRHPYCLSLDAGAGCCGGLLLAGATVRDNSAAEPTYIVSPAILSECRRLICSVLPEFEVDFTASNPVILDQKLAARL